MQTFGYTKTTNTYIQAATFVYFVPCTLAHPGLCASDDGDVLLVVKNVVKTLQDGIGKLAPGTFFVAVFTSQLTTWMAWFSLAYVRGGGPRMVMLCNAELTDPPHAVQLQCIEDCTADLMATSFFCR